MKYDVDRPISPDKNLPFGIADRAPEGLSPDEAREFFMDQALIMARRSEESGDVPVGAVVVRHGEIISAACNERERTKCATAHAETLAIERACLALHGWRLVGCELYVTLEPCPMCAGAIASARVPRLIIGAADPKGGAVGGMFDLFSTNINHKPEITRGVLEKECSALLKDFFEKKRAREIAPEEKTEGLRAVRGYVAEKKTEVEKYGYQVPDCHITYAVRITKTDGTDECIFVTKDRYFSLEERQIVDYFADDNGFVCFADEAADLHYMTLDPEPFELIRDGLKTIELRLWDEKRQMIKVGDKICFRLKGDEECTMTVEVVALHRAPSFEELYKTVPLEKCGYTKKEAKSASPDDMRKYYTEEDERKYGVVGIEIDLDMI